MERDRTADRSGPGDSDLRKAREMTTMMSPIAVGASAKTRIKVLLADGPDAAREVTVTTAES